MFMGLAFYIFATQKSLEGPEEAMPGVFFPTALEYPPKVGNIMAQHL